MPSPIDLLLDPVTLTSLAIYGALILWEALAPARTLPAVRGWRAKGVAAFALFFLVSSYLPWLWADQLAVWQLLDLSGLNRWAGAVIALLAYQAGVYAWHRSMHGSPRLWRSFHQLHHSAERLDTFGAFWFSPLDMIGWTVLSSLSLGLLGLAPEAVVLFVYFTMFLSIFQHANIRTPRWLGYFVQRPESHSHHHARDVHTGNFGDLPLFDIVFGTFENPRGFAPETGFYHGASRRVIDMLRFRDIAKEAS
ncbi:MAG TPA: sterol desaturase family protein [Steroidobacteraceae bacterium]|nr:sterol desaturase family protein [Steroidobacteraceae bacterium]HNS27546.1 sterol desaturase family protein [Steroidobacteraceae bacterium]